VGTAGKKQDGVGGRERLSRKWPGQDGQSGSFSAAFFSLNRHLAVTKQRTERRESLGKQQRLLQQAKGQQQQQQQLAKHRQPGTRSSSQQSAVEGSPVSRSRVGAGGRLCCAAARWHPGSPSQSAQHRPRLQPTSPLAVPAPFTHQLLSSFLSPKCAGEEAPKSAQPAPLQPTLAEDQKLEEESQSVAQPPLERVSQSVAHKALERVKRLYQSARALRRASHEVSSSLVANATVVEPLHTSPVHRRGGKRLAVAQNVKKKIEEERQSKPKSQKLPPPKVLHTSQPPCNSHAFSRSRTIQKGELTHRPPASRPRR